MHAAVFITFEAAPQQTTDQIRSLRNLLPTLPCAFPGLQFHMQVSDQYKTTEMFAVQFKPFVPINILQMCQGLNQPPVKITMNVSPKLATLPLLLRVSLRQWEIPREEALKTSIHLFLHLSAILDCKLNPIIDLHEKSLDTGNKLPIYSYCLTSLQFIHII